MALYKGVQRMLALSACAGALVAAGCDADSDGSGGFEISQSENERPGCDSGEGTACNGASAPAVVADATGNEFAVLWDGNFAKAERNLYGRRFDAETGDPRSDEVVVATGLPPTASPQLLAIRHPAGDGYMAAAAPYPSHAEGPPWRVLSLGPRLDLRKTADLPPRPGATLEALVGNERRREALVLEATFPTRPSGPTSSGHGIRALRIDRDGRQVRERQIGASDWEQGFAAVISAAHVPTRGEYVVATVTLAGGAVRLDVLRLDDDLGAVRPGGRPVTRGTLVETAIAHEPRGARTLLAWVEWQPDRSRRVMGAWLDADGAAGAPFIVSEDVADGNPDGVGLRVDAVGRDFVLSWTDGTMAGERRHERVTADRPGEDPTRVSYEKPGPGESTDSAAASSPLGTHLSVWTEGLRDLDGRQLRGRLGEL